jgi:hypothetical protein
VELAEGAVGSSPAAPFRTIASYDSWNARRLGVIGRPADIAGSAPWDNIDGGALLNRRTADHLLHAGAAFGYV